MTNEWDRVTNLFAAVRLLDEPARVAFLDAACPGESSLRGQIESLLAADAVHDGFLEELEPPAADRDAPHSILSPGHVLKGRYEIEERHGSGGQSIVYRATDRVLSRRVVVKVLSGLPGYHLLLKQRFEREMQALSRIDHPAVVGILDVGVLDDGAPFLVIQYVDGVSVRELLQQGRLDRRQVARILRAVGAALGAAHTAGIAHLDLKPENIMVQRLGDGPESIKLIDFGIAKIDRANPTASVITITVAGSVRYMAPEQFDGRNSKAADIYALGLVVCELLSGSPDFRLLPRTIGTPARRLLEQAMTYRPEDRPRDVKAWADELSDRLVQGVWTPRLALTVVAVLLAIAGVVRIARLPPAGNAFDAYHFSPFATEAEPKSGGVWSRDGQSVAYNQRAAGSWELFVRSLNSDAPVQLTHMATDAKSIFWWPDGSRVGFVSSGAVWAVGLAGRSPEAIQRGGVIAADLSPDGNTLALWRVDKAGAASGGLWIASPPAAAPRKSAPAFDVPGAYNPVHLRFSPDGRKLLATFYAPDAQMWLVPVADGAAGLRQSHRLFAATNFAEPPGVSWMPDSRRAVVTFVELSDAQALWMADTESQTLERLTAGTGQSDDPSVSPDGRRLVFTSYAADWDLVELPLDGAPMRDVLATSRTECCAAWIPGSAKFVYLTNRSGLPEIRVRDQIDHSDRVVASTRDFRQNAANAKLDMGAPSPDGQRVAFLEYSSSGYAIWIAATAGGVPVRLTHSPDPQETAPSWSPDGAWISFLAKDGGTPMLMRSRVGTMDAPEVVLRAGPNESSTWCCVPQWSPAGDWIALVSNDGVTLVSPDGNRRRLLSTITPIALAWSPDASRIFAISIGSDRHPILLSIALTTGAATTIRTFDPNVAFITPQNPGVLASIAADGRSLLTTVLRTRSDIWMLEGFDQPHGLLDRLRAPWRSR
jgi:eukaryotic-like serine/threonine-protein kinase